MADNHCTRNVVLEEHTSWTTHSNTPGAVVVEWNEYLKLRSILPLCLLIATPAFAQSAAQEKRFRDAIQAMAVRTYAFYVSIDPRFASLLTPVAEDPSFRDSQRCFLTRIEEEGGPGMLEEYIAGMEFQGEKEITSLIELASRELFLRVMRSGGIRSAS
ncbi:hypothetical protein [Stappia sp.]|uniref:hypothetical protein n=1 Tax=Stappia sp. TaxID=1870903 RepID=UPI003A9A4FC4